MEETPSVVLGVGVGGATADALLQQDAQQVAGSQRSECFTANSYADD